MSAILCYAFLLLSILKILKEYIFTLYPLAIFFKANHIWGFEDYVIVDPTPL